MTALGLLGSFLTGLAYCLTNYHRVFLWLSSFGLVLNWLGDSLDGNLARFRKIERPRYGFFIDHAIDTIAMLLIAIGAGLSPYARFDFILLALIAYLMISILTYLNTIVSGVFRISFFGLGPTEIRTFIILLNAFLFFRTPGTFFVSGMEIRVLDIAALLLSIILFIFYLLSMIFDARKLYQDEKKKAANTNK